MCIQSVSPSALNQFTQDRRGGVMHGVTGHQRQLRLGHCCASTSCEVCPPLVQMVPDVLISIACYAHPGLQQLKGIPVTVSTSGSFGPDYRV